MKCVLSVSFKRLLVGAGIAQQCVLCIIKGIAFLWTWIHDTSRRFGSGSEESVWNFGVSRRRREWRNKCIEWMKDLVVLVD